MTLLGTALRGTALRGTGNGLANRITGTVGDNVLDGGGGADTLVGGLEDDLYVLDHAGDRVVDGFEEGRDETRLFTSAATSGEFSLLAQWASAWRTCRWPTTPVPSASSAATGADTLY